jgi:hypothetical protein
MGLDLATLREQLSAAAARTPGLTHCWLSWAEGAPRPNVAAHLQAKCAVPIGETTWRAIYGRRLDQPANRLLPGCCSCWWLTRDYGRLIQDDCIADPDAETNCIQTLQLLCWHVAPLIKANTNRWGIPAGIAAQHALQAWLLGLHYLADAKPELGKVAVVPDVFLATAAALPKLGSEDAAEYLGDGRIRVGSRIVVFDAMQHDMLLRYLAEHKAATTRQLEDAKINNPSKTTAEVIAKHDGLLAPYIDRPTRKGDGYASRIIDARSS